MHKPTDTSSFSSKRIGEEDIDCRRLLFRWPVCLHSSLSSLLDTTRVAESKFLCGRFFLTNSRTVKGDGGRIPFSDRLSASSENFLVKGTHGSSPSGFLTGSHLPGGVVRGPELCGESGLREVCFGMASGDDARTSDVRDICMYSSMTSVQASCFSSPFILLRLCITPEEAKDLPFSTLTFSMLFGRDWNGLGRLLQPIAWCSYLQRTTTLGPVWTTYSEPWTRFS
ncbi:hypothetical protein KC19_VG258800 [Ceratodon purpureus]|uniref:Uncharacterized protein n=1 Tax=Ceratodon purpureus TaxID=3225 RepID=A0A8T0HUG1_CERPU|nr:hypothetical protein KC19_VG258800 [Ceratodon purpureus]